MFRKVKKRHSSSSSQSSEISTKSKSVDSSLGGLSRSSTVASLDTDSTKSSGNSTSETCAEFRVKYVGAIEKLQFDMSKTLHEPLDLINYIDAAQQDGKLPFVPGDEEMILGVSKHGVKVASLDQCARRGMLEPIPADFGRQAEYTLDWSPANGRAHIDKQPFTLTFIPMDNLESPINLTCMFLECGRKPEYPEKTHAHGRTCKLHTDLPDRSSRSPDCEANMLTTRPPHYVNYNYY
ncbi:integrin beta-1-binding protein 1 isoform X1 [Dunckerocampus dactyliophorus]|uniref:integrin beta-1-binding protein 1 isoform X1 n=1 Tax=Dunckerocampus dactyliophorus TaxID=161453 RepID=UPI00240506C4|nr:integrin beta-1-binding protein 1 isoform X1 [Dunckerocampus dactyliophorus]